MPGRGSPPQTTDTTKNKGDWGEQLAAQHLVAQGYRIVERNYRCRRGEIDIIAEDGGVLCFVEVRSVASRAFGDPLETIKPAKQRRILLAARHYITTRRIRDKAIRFDVVGVVHQPELEIRLVRGAFEDRQAW